MQEAQAMNMQIAPQGRNMNNQALNHSGPWPSTQCIEMLEIQLLLPALMVESLERLGHSRGQTIGRLVRSILAGYLADEMESRTGGTVYGLERMKEPCLIAE